ncbi:hypothetical protein DSL72_007889 [Monilinia vaccinii-corymbosi]|uniref:Uncharacterized protein n=1 Tax=Monilinia vaccinii-corymbosi TaxID=61207 RepID=A0A8A3PI69_9HELO|nr:hypothetical protein DSL72_007889 [Monilinia vaccinii-corymbosi]
MSNPWSNRFTRLAQLAHPVAASSSQLEALARKMAEIPSHPYLNYTHSDRALGITLDFTAPCSPLEQAELARSLNPVLPKYSEHATHISIAMSFKCAREDLVTKNINAHRHCILASIVYALNKFARIDSLGIAVSVPRFDWEQFQPVSAIYGLDYKK